MYPTETVLVLRKCRKEDSESGGRKEVRKRRRQVYFFSLGMRRADVTSVCGERFL